MLKLKGITKDYAVGDETVHALKGIDLEFRKSEFVAVLGHSGCGKTTLLNIIGGLDHVHRRRPCDQRPIYQRVHRPRLGQLTATTR